MAGMDVSPEPDDFQLQATVKASEEQSEMYLRGVEYDLRTFRAYSICLLL